MANEWETLKTLKEQSKVNVSLNWFSGSVQTGIIVEVRLDECKCIKQTSYYMYLYLSLIMDIEKNYSWEHKCLGNNTTRAVSKYLWVKPRNILKLLEKLRVFKHGKTYLFPSQIGSSIPTFRDIHLHLIVLKT